MSTGANCTSTIIGHHQRSGGNLKNAVYEIQASRVLAIKLVEFLGKSTGISSRSFHARAALPRLNNGWVTSPYKRWQHIQSIE